MVQRLVSLTVGTNDEAYDYFQIFNQISEIATDLDKANHFGYINVSSQRVDDEDAETEKEPRSEPLHYDEFTLMKVRRALLKYGISDNICTDLITNMQNEGILFRERPR